MSDWKKYQDDKQIDSQSNTEYMKVMMAIAIFGAQSVIKMLGWIFTSSIITYALVTLLTFSVAHIVYHLMKNKSSTSKKIMRPSLDTFQNKFEHESNYQTEARETEAPPKKNQAHLFARFKNTAGIIRLASDADNQHSRIQNLATSLARAIRRRFHPADKRYDHSVAAIKTASHQTLESLSEVWDLMSYVTEIDLSSIESRLSVLQTKSRLSRVELLELESLNQRIHLRQELITRISEHLSRNERIIAELIDMTHSTENLSVGDSNPEQRQQTMTQTQRGRGGNKAG